MKYSIHTFKYKSYTYSFHLPLSACLISVLDKLQVTSKDGWRSSSDEKLDLHYGAPNDC